MKFWLMRVAININTLIRNKFLVTVGIFPKSLSRNPPELLS